MDELQAHIQAVNDRNQRVEADKAWETSVTRRFFIMCITYATASLFLYLIDVEQFLINALVPTGGYLLSTLSLSWAKRWWLRSMYQR